MESHTIREIVENIPRAKVLVIGDLMLEKFIRGNLTRISDEAPVPIVDFTSEIIRPGGAANATLNIRALGGNAVAFGVIGDDPEGHCLKDLLSAAKVDTTGIITSRKRCTLQKTRIIAEKLQQNLIIVEKKNSTGLDTDTTGELLKKIKKAIDSVDAILISDYDDGVITTELLEELIPLAKKKGKTLVVDSKIEHFHNFRDVDIVKVSHQVASDITGIGQINETSIRNIGQWMLTQLESRCVLITQGKNGMTLFDNNGDVTHIASIAKETLEATGVADTVAAVLALSLGVDRMKMAEAAFLANTVAGIKVGKIGTATVTKDELVHTLEHLKIPSLVQVSRT